MREYRFLLLPLAMLVIVLALILVPTTSTLLELIPVWGLYAPIYGVLLPFFLLVMAVVR